jgi:hypothetical protein
LRKIGSKVCSRARRRASSLFGWPSSAVWASLLSIAAFTACQSNFRKPDGGRLLLLDKRKPASRQHFISVGRFLDTSFDMLIRGASDALRLLCRECEDIRLRLE